MVFMDFWIWQHCEQNHVRNTLGMWYPWPARISNTPDTWKAESQSDIHWWETDYFKILSEAKETHLLPLPLRNCTGLCSTQSNSEEEELGFTLHKMKSRRWCKVYMRYRLCWWHRFAFQQYRAKEKTRPQSVWKWLNVRKTKAMFNNTNLQPLWSMEGSKIKQALTEIGEQEFKEMKTLNGTTFACRGKS